MGYLDNTVITVDAILTKAGRQALARNDGSFRITQFALGDDEVDYTLYNEDHPNGSQYNGEAIENMPILEAFPDENNIMIHKLVTLPRGTSKLPVVTANISAVQLSLGATTTVNPTTLNFSGLSNLKEPGGYFFTLADRRLFTQAQTQIPQIQELQEREGRTTDEVFDLDDFTEAVVFQGPEELEEIRRLQRSEESRFSPVGGPARRGGRVTGLTEQ